MSHAGMALIKALVENIGLTVGLSKALVASGTLRGKQAPGRCRTSSPHAGAAIRSTAQAVPGPPGPPPTRRSGNHTKKQHRQSEPAALLGLAGAGPTVIFRCS